jgi:hypothetical protein
MEIGCRAIQEINKNKKKWEKGMSEGKKIEIVLASTAVAVTFAVFLGRLLALFSFLSKN